jgi:signal transduction histidine kinase
LEAFSYTVAHDLRAPLRSMQNFSVLLLHDYSTQLAPEGIDMLQRIKASSERMDRLISDLLEYSRLGRIPITEQRVHVGFVLDAVLTDLAQEIRAKNAEITVQYPLPDVFANTATVSQIFTNLITNALKFTAPSQRPIVKIHAETREEWVRLIVQDHGIGIAPEHRDRIFRMFERLHTNESYPGTGLGLAIVRKAIERLGVGGWKRERVLVRTQSLSRLNAQTSSGTDPGFQRSPHPPGPCGTRHAA